MLHPWEETGGRKGRKEKGGRKRAGRKGREEMGGKKRAGKQDNGREEKGCRQDKDAWVEKGCRQDKDAWEEKGCQQDKDAWVDALLDEIKHVPHDAPVRGTRQSRSGTVLIKGASIRHGKQLNKPT
jgi:hypothetical protein